MKKAISSLSILFFLVLMTAVSSQAAVKRPAPTPPPTHTEVRISYTTNGFGEGAQVKVDGKSVGGVSRNAKPLVLKLKNDKTYTITLHFRGPRGVWTQTKTIHIPWAQNTPITIQSTDGGISSSVDAPPRRR